MIAGPSSAPKTMLEALDTWIAALNVASRVDVDRSAADREFFAARKAELAPQRQSLKSKIDALDEHDRSVGKIAQLGVALGDVVLDRGVRAANAACAPRTRRPRPRSATAQRSARLTSSASASTI